MTTKMTSSGPSDPSAARPSPSSRFILQEFSFFLSESGDRNNNTRESFGGGDEMYADRYPWDWGGLVRLDYARLCV